MSTERGFTLIETIVAMVVIVVVIGGLTGIFSMARHSADPMIQKMMFSAAESLMEEVRLAGFTWCDPEDANAATATSAAGCMAAATTEGLGPEANDARPYDNVNDYNEFCAKPMSPITDVAGNGFPSLAGYEAKICVSTAALGTLADTGDIQTAPVLRIDITVSRDASSYTLSGWRTRYAPNAP